jgi:precorrin-6B methylase 1
MNYEILLQIPGRIRIKLDKLYKNQKLAEFLISSTYESIYSINPNIYTSNILILYNCEKSNPKNIINYIKYIVNNLNTNKRNDSKDTELNIPISKIKLKTNELRKNLTLKYNVFKKYVLKIKNIKHIRKILAALGFAVLFNYNIKLALLLLTVYYLNKFINSVLNRLYINRIQNNTTYKISKNIKKLLLNETANNESNSISDMINTVEIFAVFLGLIIFCLSGNSNILISSLILMQMNLTPLISSLTYISAYFKMKQNSIFLNNKLKLQKLDTIDTLILMTDEYEYINASLIEDLRERGILDIQIISSSENSYLKQLEFDLELNVTYCISLEKELIKKIRNLKNQNKKVVVVSSPEDLIIHKKIAEDIDLNILIADKIDYRCKNYDIIILNNYYFIGDTIDYIKYIQEKVAQNTLLSFWIYIYCNILIFCNNIYPLYIWIIALLNKAMVYFNSLKPLRYNSNTE